MTPDNFRDDPERTASGLREGEIDPGDLAALREACVLNTPGFSLPTPEVHSAELEIGAPQPLKLKIAPLPRRAKINRVNLDPPRPRINRGLPLAMEQPITRHRMLIGDLSEGQCKSLFKKIYDRYGPLAEELHVMAVFAQVPPEAARTIELAPDLRTLRFTIPPDVSPRTIKEGFHLAVLEGAGGQTRNLLVRL